MATSSTGPRCPNGCKSGNAQVYSFNTVSLALREKLGFARDGALRRMVYTGGQHHDIVAFGVTDDELAARYPALVWVWY